MTLFVIIISIRVLNSHEKAIHANADKDDGVKIAAVCHKLPAYETKWIRWSWQHKVLSSAFVINIIGWRPSIYSLVGELIACSKLDKFNFRYGMLGGELLSIGWIKKLTDLQIACKPIVNSESSSKDSV